MTESQELNTRSLVNSNGRIKNSTIGFLIYFIPLFSLKMLGLDVTGNVGIVITVLSVLLSIVIMRKLKYNRNRITIWATFLLIGVLTIMTSGKYSIFFSIYTLFFLDNVKEDQFKYIYRSIFIVGTILLSITLVLSINTGDEQSRFINGAFTTITKRSNFIYVDFFTLANIYLLMKKKAKIIPFCIIFIILGYFLYLYTGSRTGFVCVIAVCLFLIVFDKTSILQKKLIKKIIPFFPIFLFLINLLINWGYGRIPIINQLNLMLQNRLRYGFLYLNTYRPKFLGQRIAESYAVESYQILDNTYLSLWLIYGLIVTVAWLVLNSYSVKNLNDRMKTKELAILFGYLLYGFTESFVIVAFISMVFFVYSECLHNYQFSHKRRNKRRRIELFRGKHK